MASQMHFLKKTEMLYLQNAMIIEGGYSVSVFEFELICTRKPGCSPAEPRGSGAGERNACGLVINSNAVLMISNPDR